jgi:AmmeMemoRadiSam system protein B
MNLGPLPRLRPVEAVPVEVDGAVLMAVRDPEGVCEETVMLAPAAFFLATLLDGRAGPGEVRRRFAEAIPGAVLSDQDLAAVVRALDEHGFLDTPSYRLRRASARARFARLDVRPAAHAGGAYPEDPAELRALIGELLAEDERHGEGTPPLPQAPDPSARPVLLDASGRPVSSSAASSRPAARLVVPGAAGAAPAAGTRPRGLIVPHIDFGRGGFAYAAAYRTLVESGPPPLVIVLGVLHAPASAPFALTAKPFETPLGTVETDADAVQAVARAAGEWVFEEEYAHRLEHSVEFQVVWLRALPAPAPFRIVPVLCSAFEGFTGTRSPREDERVRAGLDAIAALARERDALLIASVDFSHVGSRFGDELEPDQAAAEAVRVADAALLDVALAGDAEAFWAAGTAGGNPRRVDALSAVYTLLHGLKPPATGRRLAYGQAPDPAGGLVSFASAAFA